MPLHPLIQEHREAIIRLAKQYGASDVRLFGSAARGDSQAASDIDLLVRFAPERSLLDHAGLMADLKELLGVKVDVLSENGLSGSFRARILAEVVPL